MQPATLNFTRSRKVCTRRCLKVPAAEGLCPSTPTFDGCRTSSRAREVLQTGGTLWHRCVNGLLAHVAGQLYKPTFQELKACVARRASKPFASTGTGSHKTSFITRMHEAEPMTASRSCLGQQAAKIDYLQTYQLAALAHCIS